MIDVPVQVIDVCVFSRQPGKSRWPNGGSGKMPWVCLMDGRSKLKQDIIAMLADQHNKNL